MLKNNHKIGTNATKNMSHSDVSTRLINLSKSGDFETLKEFKELLKQPDFNPNTLHDGLVLWHVVLERDSTKEQLFATEILALQSVDFEIRSENDRGDGALHLLARQRPSNQEGYARKTSKFRLLIASLTEWASQQDESSHCRGLASLINAPNRYNQTAAHNLVEDYRYNAKESVAEQLQVLLDTKLVKPFLKDNSGMDLLIKSTNRRNKHATKKLLDYYRSNKDDLSTNDMTESVIFGYAFLLKGIQLGGVNESDDLDFIDIQKDLTTFYYGDIKKQLTDVLQTISVADVMDGLVQVCLLNKRAPGQVELLAEALGENVTDTPRENLLFVLKRKWHDLMVVCIHEERVDLLQVISADPDLTKMIRNLTEQQLRDIYFDCSGEHSALYTLDIEKSGGKCSLKELFKKVTSPERRPEVIPTGVLFPPCHYTFPFLCLVLGKLKLLRAYFELFSLPESFPQGVFIAWMARLFLKHGQIANKEMQENLTEVINVVDKLFCENINAITRHSACFYELIQPVFFDTQISCLGKKTLLELAIAGRCGVFLRSKMCKEQVCRKEGGLLVMKDVGTWKALAQVLMRLLFVALQPALQIFKVCCLIPCLMASVLLAPSAMAANHCQSQAGDCCRRFVGIPTIVVKLNKQQNKVLNPMVRFYLDLISTAVFLFLLSILVTRHLHQTPGYCEVAVMIFGACYTLEALRSVANHARERTLPRYVATLWNMADIAAFISLSCAFSTRAWSTIFLSDYEKMAEPAKGTFRESRDLKLFWARVFYMCALLMLHIKFLRVAALWESLGVKLKMIYQMIVVDLTPFLLILGMVLAAFGCVFVGLLYPNGLRSRDAADTDSGISWFVGSQSFKYSFYALIGELTVLEDSGASCTAQSCPHPIGSQLVSLVFLVLFVVLANVLLLNLLIGLFSATIERVQGQAYELWFADRALLKEEYMRRSAMPPPFNLPDIAVDILCWCLTRLRSAAQILEDCKQAEQLRKEEQALLMLALTLAWSGRGREKLRLGSLQPRQSSNMIQSDEVEQDANSWLGRRMELAARKRGLSGEELARLVETM